MSRHRYGPEDTCGRSYDIKSLLGEETSFEPRVPMRHSKLVDNLDATTANIDVHPAIISEISLAIIAVEMPPEAQNGTEIGSYPTLYNLARV